MSVVKKPAIPSVQSLPPPLAQVLAPMKENIELLTGVRGAPLKTLPAGTVLADVVAKINEIVARLNGTGQ